MEIPPTISMTRPLPPNTPIPQSPRQIRSPRGGAGEHREAVGASNHLGISSLSPPTPKPAQRSNPSPGPLGRCPLAGGGARRIPHRSPHPRTTTIAITSRKEPATLRRPSGGVHLQPPDLSGGEGPRRLPPSMALIAPSIMVANPPGHRTSGGPPPPPSGGRRRPPNLRRSEYHPVAASLSHRRPRSAGSCPPRPDPSPVVVLSSSAERPGAFNDLRDDPVPSMTLGNSPPGHRPPSPQYTSNRIGSSARRASFPVWPILVAPQA